MNIQVSEDLVAIFHSVLITDVQRLVSDLTYAQFLSESLLKDKHYLLLTD